MTDRAEIDTEIDTETDAGVDTEIRALYARMCRAWSSGDAEAYGACFTDDCDYVAFDGSHVRGRAAVVRSHDALFRGVLNGSRLVGEVTGTRRLGRDAALAHGLGSIVVAWRARPPRRRLTVNTLVAVRCPEGWRFAAIHNGRVRPLTVPQPDAVPSRVARALVRGARTAGLGRYRRSA